MLALITEPNSDRSVVSFRPDFTYSQSDLRGPQRPIAPVFDISMPPVNIDVAIVGGGPSGLALGLSLAQYEIKVSAS
jgi:NADPH-dependent 2,4-dienoyl-CoA reductase/sulfur reductase-like enzyme